MGSFHQLAKPSVNDRSLRVADDRCRKASVGGASQGVLDDRAKSRRFQSPPRTTERSAPLRTSRANTLKGRPSVATADIGRRVCVGARAALALSRTTYLFERTAFRHTEGRMLDVTAEGRVSHVLTNLGEALAAGDLDRALRIFQDDCYWRDLVTFTWNIKTVEGKDAIRAMLKAQLSSVKPSALDPRLRGGRFGRGRRHDRLVHLRDGRLPAATASCVSRTGRSGRCSPLRRSSRATRSRSGSIGRSAPSTARASIG